MTLVIGNDLVHLRLARHMDTKSEISTGLISFVTLIWVVIASLTENSLPSHIILKFHLACNADAERDPSRKKTKIYHGKLKIRSKIGWIFFLSEAFYLNYIVWFNETHLKLFLC